MLHAKMQRILNCLVLDVSVGVGPCMQSLAAHVSLPLLVLADYISTMLLANVAVPDRLTFLSAQMLDSMAFLLNNPYIERA